MCWTSKKIPVLKKAEKPIPVFKILLRNMDSVYMHFKYHLHTKYFQKLEVPHITGFRCCIFEGIHSYDAKMSFIKKYPTDRNFFAVAIKNKEWFYLDTFIKSCAYIQVMGVIPEGAEYYRNECGEIVSNSIILTEIKQII